MRYNFDTKDFQIAHKLNDKIILFDDYKEHFHIGYEFLLFIDGDLEYVIENQKYILKPFDLLLIKPGQHHYVNFNSTGRYERFVITFEKSLVPLHISTSFNNKEQCISIINTPIADIFERLDNCRKEFDGETLYEISKCLLTELIIYFNKYAKDTKSEKNNTIVNSIINDVINYISLNIEKELSIKHLAEKFNVSSSYLCAAFKETMQTNISRYIRSKRVILAQSYIEHGEKPTEVFIKCGFGDYSTFYRSYTKIIGYPPSKK